MNAIADRLEDGFPHGTPEGYKQGCRGNICPAGADHGLSCSRAKQLAAGDYRYQKLVKKGLSPFEIAQDLGLVPDPAAVVSASQQSPRRLTSTQPAVVASERESAEPPAAAPEPEVAAAVPVQERVGPSQSQIRAWARANGIDVNPKGIVRADVQRAYLAAHPDDEPAAPIEPVVEPPVEPVEPVTPATEVGPVEPVEHAAPDELSAAAVPSEVTAEDLDAWAADVDGDSFRDQLDELRDRIDAPAPDPILTPDPDLLEGATTPPNPGVAVMNAGEFAARWNTLSASEREAWVTSMRVARDAAERADQRPEWSQVSMDAAVEQARSFADRVVAENALLIEQLATAHTALATALAAWDRATGELTVTALRADKAVRLLMHREAAHQIAADAAAARRADLEGTIEVQADRIAELAAAAAAGKKRRRTRTAAN